MREHIDELFSKFETKLITEVVLLTSNSDFVSMEMYKNQEYCSFFTSSEKNTLDFNFENTFNFDIFVVFAQKIGKICSKLAHGNVYQGKVQFHTEINSAN